MVLLRSNLPAGKANKTALLWKAGVAGRQYSYNDIRLASNTIGAYLRSSYRAGIASVCSWTKFRSCISVPGVVKIGQLRSRSSRRSAMNRFCAAR